MCNYDIPTITSPGNVGLANVSYIFTKSVCSERREEKEEERRTSERREMVEERRKRKMRYIELFILEKKKLNWKEREG